MNPSMIFNLLNLVEMFSYSLLFDIKFHHKFIEFLMKLKATTKFPSLKIPITKQESNLPSKYLIYGIESNLIIVNSGFMIIILFIIIILTLLAYLGSLVGNNFTKRICLKVLNALFFSWYFRFCIQSCFDITIFSLISIKYSQFEGNISIFNLTCCLLMLVIIN